MDYQTYISSVLTIDQAALYAECIEIAKMNTQIEVNIGEILTRATSASKILSFNSGRNHGFFKS